MRSLLVLCLVFFYDVAEIFAADGDSCFIFPSRVDPGRENVAVVLANFAPTECFVTVENIGTDNTKKLVPREVSARSLTNFVVPEDWNEVVDQGEIQMEVEASYGGERNEKTNLLGQIKVQYQPTVLIQLSHPVYNPGDTVMYRILLTDGLTKPLARADTPFEVTVALQHEAQHTVASWPVQLHPSELHSGQYLLTDDRDVGEWNLTVTIGDHTTKKPFEVVPYGAPVHTITIDAVTVDNKKLVLAITAFYTFGKPIAGTMTLTVTGGENPIPPQVQPLSGKGTATVTVPMKKLMDALEEQPTVRVVNVSVTVDTTNGLTHRVYHHSKAIPIHPDQLQLTLHRMVGFVPGQNATVLVQATRLDGTALSSSREVAVSVWGADDDGNAHGHRTFDAILPPGGTLVLSVPTETITRQVTFDVTYRETLSTSITLEAVYYPKLFARIIPVKVGSSESGPNFKLGIASSHVGDGMLLVYRKHSGTDHEEGILNGVQNYYEHEPTGTVQDINELKSVYIFAKVNDMLVQTSVSHEEPVLPRQVNLNIQFNDNMEHVVNVSAPHGNSVVGLTVYEGLLDKIPTDYINRHLMFNGSLSDMTDAFTAVSTNELFITPSPKLTFGHPMEQTPMPNTMFNRLLLWKQAKVSSRSKVAQFKMNVPAHVNRMTMTAFAFSKTTGLDFAVPVHWERNVNIGIYLHVPYSARKMEPVVVDVYLINNHNQRVDLILLELLNTANEFAFLNNSGRTDATSKSVYGRLEPYEVQRAEFHIRPRKLGSINLIAIAYTSNKVISSAETILRTVPESVQQTASIVRTFSIEDSVANFTNMKVPIPPIADPGSEKITLSLHHVQLKMATLSASVLLDKLIETDPFTMAVKASLTLDVLGLAKLDWPERYEPAMDMVTRSLNQIERLAKEDGSFQIADAHQPSTACWDTVIAVRALMSGNAHQGRSGAVRDKSILKALTWLKNQQTPYGHFCNDETLSEQLRIELTAHALLIFSSMPTNAWEYVTVIENMRTYLSSKIAQLDDAYHLALVGYALQFSARRHTGSSSDTSNALAVDSVLRMLLEKKQQTPTYTKLWWSSATGRDLEATSYALLLLTSKELLLDAAPIVNWVKRQPYRKMAPVIEPDSHLALRALIAYATRTTFLDQKYKAVVAALNKGHTIYETTLERDSLTHVISLPPATRSVSFTINGTIAGALEINYSYMENVASQKAKFALNVLRAGTSTEDYVDWSICVRFLPKGHMERTRMVTCEISFPTGYIALDESVEELEELENVVSTTLRNDETQLAVTFEEITLQGQCFNVTGFRRSRATRQLPGIIKVFDVTDTSNFAFKNFDTQN